MVVRCVVSGLELTITVIVSLLRENVNLSVYYVFSANLHFFFAFLYTCLKLEKRYVRIQTNR